MITKNDEPLMALKRLRNIIYIISTLHIYIYDIYIYIYVYAAEENVILNDPNSAIFTLYRRDI